MPLRTAEKNIINDAIIKDLSDSVHGLRDGIVRITVQDFKIVEVDVARKNRYDDVWNMEQGGGI